IGLHVLVDQIKYVSEGLDTVLTQPLLGKGASSFARQVEEEKSSSTIKLEDLAKLVSNVQPSFKDLDSPEDDPVIIIDESDEEGNDEIYATKNVETEDTLVPKSSSPKSSLIQELTNQLKELLVLVSTSSKARDKSVPSAGQADTMPVEGEKNTNQATISQLFQRRAKKVNLNKTQPEKITPPLIPPIITITTQIQSPFPQRTPKESSRTKGEHIKKDKGKKVMSSEDTEEESTESNSNDKTTHVPGSTVDSSSKKELKKFNFVTEGGEHVYLTKEQISSQKEIEEEAKAKAARREGEIKKEELIDLLGLEVVNKYYNDKLQYDKYCDKMQNRRAASRITNCDVMTRKGPITLLKCT
ncbi:hypothetical protein Tco_1471224, partial [Tanacetum coccineum]